jgi:hypothetical protein
MTGPRLERTSIVVASSELVASDLAGETVLLSLSTAHYHGYAGVGARIWELVQSPIAVAKVCEIIAQEHDVDAVRCEQDVLAFLASLQSRDLLQVRGDA